MVDITTALLSEKSIESTISMVKQKLRIQKSDEQAQFEAKKIANDCLQRFVPAFDSEGALPLPKEGV